jgi:Predicted restriction endonuclease
MNAPLEHLDEALTTLHSTWAGASIDGASDIDLDALPPASTLSDAGLVRVTDAVGRLLRDAEAVLTQVAGEVARRSPSELGKDGLAKKQGFLNVARMVAASTGGSIAAAGRAVAVGSATMPGRSLTGEPLAPAHPHVAGAVASGSISVEAAAAITSMLGRVASRADVDETDRVERVLAQRAADLPLDLLMRVIREAEARLDRDGVAPREEELQANRMLSMHEDSRGMLHGRFTLDSATGAPVKAAIEAIVTQGIRATREDRVPASSAGIDDGAVIPDNRTIPQRQADALASMATHVIGCKRMPEASATTLVVRTDLAVLTEGIGHGTIDGLSQPVSAGTVRRMAASAGIIPAVLGTDSLPLDLGRTARLFSPAQRIALAERDGGCACCGLDVAYAEAHHIRWWKRDTGPTDLENGVLLCPPCHTRAHEDGWAVRVDEHDDVWFVPPPHVDSARTPRLGGRARFRLSRAA